MYIPSSFRIDHEPTLFNFIERYSFATLVSTVDGVPFATHLPLLVDRAGPTLWGHVARANTHWQQFARGGESLAIFSGPHAYISPTWYETQPSVPTWNYAAVHADGVPAIVDDQRLAEIVDRLVAKYESRRANPWPNDLPADYRQQLLAAVVGFELPIRRLEGKFKLGQNRPAIDQQTMLEHLQQGNAEAQALAEFISEQRQATI